jgi:hypothetical protein
MASLKDLTPEQQEEMKLLAISMGLTLETFSVDDYLTYKGE